MTFDLDLELLRRLDRYLDAAPRTAATVEAIGPFTLFLGRPGGFRYYARPIPGAPPATPRAVVAVRGRQRALGVPEAFEWIAELSPELEAAAVAAGLEVRRHVLMHLPPEAVRPAPPPAGFSVRLLTPEDGPAAVHGVAMVAFGFPGTAMGPAGLEALGPAAAGVPPSMAAFVRERLRAGTTVIAAAWGRAGPVAVGSHQPVGDASEVVGVGVLPAYRRMGLAAAVTWTLVRDAHERGVRTVFLSAGDEAVARVYARVGFERVGTAAAAEPPDA